MAAFKANELKPTLLSLDSKHITVQVINTVKQLYKLLLLPKHHNILLCLVL